MLNDYARGRLKACVRRPTDDRQSGTDNPLLTEVTADIKKQNPDDFHTDESLKDRRFFNQPKHGIQGAFYVVPFCSTPEK